MRVRNPLFFFAVATAVVLSLPACSGGSGGGGDDDDLVGNGDLSTGEYLVSASVIAQDLCFVMDGLDGDIDDVEVTGTDILYNSSEGTITDGVFDAVLAFPLDLNDDPFGAGAIDCVLGREARYIGATTAEDAADVEYTFSVDAGEGAECDDAPALIEEVIGEAIALPCESTADYHVERIPPPPPLVGVLSLLATNGQLTIAGVEASNSGFTLTGSFDAGGTFSEPSDVWTCYAPEPPAFPNYDLYIGGADYFVTLSVTTASWAVGSVPVLDLFEATIAGPDSIATMTSGSLMILGAPMVVDSAYRCAVQLVDVPFTDVALQSPAAPARRTDAERWTLDGRRR